MCVCVCVCVCVLEGQCEWRERLFTLTSFLSKAPGHRGVDLLDLLVPLALAPEPGGVRMPCGPGRQQRPPRRAWVPRNRGPPCLPSRLLPGGERLGHPGPEAEEQDFAWPTLDSRWGKLGVDPVTPEDEVLEGWSGLRAGYP